jgi:hypothetical protein
LAVLPALATSAQAETAPPGGALPSWNDGGAKQAILDFVTPRTTQVRNLGIWSSIQHRKWKNETDYSFIWNKPSRRALSLSNYSSFVGNVAYLVCEGANELRY